MPLILLHSSGPRISLSAYPPPSLLCLCPDARICPMLDSPKPIRGSAEDETKSTLKTQRLACHGHSSPISRIGRKERLRSNCCGQNRVWEERRAGRTAGVLAAGIDMPDPDRPDMGQHFRSLSQCFAPEGVWSTTTRNDFGAHRTRSWVQSNFRSVLSGAPWPAGCGWSQLR